MATVYALRVRCLKRHTCTGCGCVYRVRKELFVNERARSEESAAKTATKRINAELETEPNAVACPDCGQYQPDLVGLEQARSHGFITLVGVGVVAILAFLTSILDITGNTTGIVLAFIALSIGIAHVFVGTRNPNRNPAENRKLSREMEDRGELDVTRSGDLELLRPPVGPFTRWHTVGLLGVLTAAIILLTPSVARERTSIASTILSVRPGEELTLNFTDSIDAVNGLWRGVPKVTVQNPQDFGNQPPAIVATSNVDQWPANVKYESGRERMHPPLWARIAVPRESRLTGKTLELKIDLEVTYPSLDGKIVRDRRTNIWKDLSVRVANEIVFGRIWQIPIRWVGIFFGTLTLAFAGLFLTAIGNGLARMAEPVKAVVEEVAASLAAARDERPTPSDPHAAARVARRTAEEAEDNSTA